MLKDGIIDGEKFFKGHGLVLQHKNGEEVNFSIDGSSNKITANSLASLGYWMMDYGYFFRQRYSLNIRHSSDFDGSGQQSIEINRADRDKYSSEWQLRLVYSEQTDNSDDFIYEAELISDTRTGYPYGSKNHGLRRFKVHCAFLNQSPTAATQWVAELYLPWKKDLERLQRASESLAHWVDAGLGMDVSCRPCARAAGLGGRIKPTKFSNHILKGFANKGLDLTNLRSKLKCKKCGQRDAILLHA